MTKKIENMSTEREDGLREAEVLTQLSELTKLITNALGYEPADAQKNEKAGKQVNVEALAAKTITKQQPELIKYDNSQKLMPENMTYKAEPDQEEVRIESVEPAEDAQDKDLEAALETALSKLKRMKHTLTVNEEAALTPSDEM
tara:strand:+ start:854 stop:1285 length:432 start_codon:yes stop_codon:yes gene_type:complete